MEYNTVKVAKFEKVSYEQFEKDLRSDGITDDSFILQAYESIKLPERSTSGSAGYDFYLPYNISNGIECKSKVYTGIKCQIADGWVLNIYPRSSLGIKLGITMANTVGIIDSDYYNNPSNEGHIIIALNYGTTANVPMIEQKLQSGDRFVQGIFTPYGITYDDNVSVVREGGIGSTNK